MKRVKWPAPDSRRQRGSPFASSDKENPNAQENIAVDLSFNLSGRLYSFRYLGKEIQVK